MKHTMTAEKLRELVHYDPESGAFTWLNVSKFGTAKVGAIAGSRHAQGYRQINFRREVYLCHRLAWLYVHGEWPSACIDHINGDKADNRLANLRSVTSTINAQNVRRAQVNNSLGLLGVSRDKKKFSARLLADGLRVHVGSFDTPAEAHAAYLTAKRQLHAGCTI